MPANTTFSRSPTSFRSNNQGLATAARYVTMLLGFAFLAAGAAGFIWPGLLHFHLSPAHNLVHLASGAVAVYLGWKGSATAVQAFNWIFGSVYFVLGIAGFFMGSPSSASVGHTAADERLLKVIPGALELGTVDHAFHVCVGLVLMLAAAAGLIAQGRGTRRFESEL